MIIFPVCFGWYDVQMLACNCPNSWSCLC